MVLVLGLPADLTNHLTRALVEHCRWCRTNGIPLPLEVSDLLDHLAHGGQERTNPPPAEHRADTDDVLLLLTFGTVAERLAVSERTVRRLTASGTLPVVEVAGCKRVRVTALAAYVEGL